MAPRSKQVGLIPFVPRPVLMVGGGVLGAGLAGFLLWRYVIPAKWKAKLTRKAGTAVSEASKLALQQVWPAGADPRILDAAFTVGAETGLSPFLLLGITGLESRFGLALTPPRPDGTGDDIPRKVTRNVGTKENPKTLDQFMAKNPLPGAVRKMAVDPMDRGAGEQMCWVPSLRNGEGWGHGLYQLDWVYHQDFIKTGKWKDPTEAMRYMATKILVAYQQQILKALPDLSGMNLLRATVASYNAGPKRVIAAIKAGKDPATVTFGYADGHDYPSQVLGEARKLLTKAGLPMPF